MYNLYMCVHFPFVQVACGSEHVVVLTDGEMKITSPTSHPSPFYHVTGNVDKRKFGAVPTGKVQIGSLLCRGHMCIH